MLTDKTQKRSERGTLPPGEPDHLQRDANGVGFDGPQDDTATAQIAHTGWNERDALSGLDQSQEGLHHVGLVDHAWREPGAAAEPQALSVAGTGRVNPTSSRPARNSSI